RKCGGEPLALHIFDAVLPIPSQHDPVLEVPLDAVRRLESVQVNGAMGPLAFQAEISPGLDVGVTPFACRGVNSVELCKRESLDGVVLIDEDDGGGRLTEGTHTAGGHPDGQRLVAELINEGLLLGRQQLAAYRSYVRTPLNQTRRASTGGARFHRHAQLR